MVELEREKKRLGYRRMKVLMGREGENVKEKRVNRVYREEGMMIWRKKRKN